MNLAMKRDFHRWSAWYPARWQEQNGAAMLGTYLDLADAEGRDRLTRSEKVAMVVGGLDARAERLVPGAVRDRLTIVMTGLLGAYGLITGLIFEWAPWTSAARANWLDGYGSADPIGFGPFLSAFVIVAGLAIVAWASSLVGPVWLYRSLLVATAATGTTLAGVGHLGVLGDQPWLSSVSCAFAALIALLALPGRRPRASQSLICAGIWILAFCASTIAFGPWTPAHFFTGTVPVLEFFSGVVQPMLAYTGSVVALIVALLFALMRRSRIAAVIVLATTPWSLLLINNAGPLAGGSPTHELMLAIPLILGYVTATAFAVVLRRRADVRNQTGRAAEIGRR